MIRVVELKGSILNCCFTSSVSLSINRACQKLNAVKIVYAVKNSYT